MESIATRQNKHLFSRYYILKEGLFKNTKKILNIYRESLVLENIDETEKELIPYETILNVEVSDKNNKDFKLYYQGKSGPITVSFSTSLRKEAVSDILRQMVINSFIQLGSLLENKQSSCRIF